jgi:hypothetical protein
MSEQSFPVMVAVRRADGSVEQVRVGTATRQGEGFALRLGELTIGAVADVSRAPSAPRASAPSAAGGGLVFPPYGRSKGMPIAGASVQDLEFYANGCRRTLADPAKSRWHDKERALLAAIEAELAGQRGAPVGGGSAWGDGPPPDDDLPPRTDDEAPPAGLDDDIPF